MEKEQITELKDAASKAVCEMIDKMFVETDVNDSAIAINIIGHDIKGYEFSLNQYSTEININGSITVSLPKFIRYPEYFGKAVRNSIRKFKEDQIQKVRDHIAKDAIERSEGEWSTIWDELRAMEDGLRALESTGFRTENIERIVTTIRTATDRYEEDEPVPVTNEVMGVDEPLPEAIQNQEVRDDMPLEAEIEAARLMINLYFHQRGINRTQIDSGMREELYRISAREYISRDIMSAEINAHNLALQQNEGYTPEELTGAVEEMHPPTNNRQTAQIMIREYLRELNLDVDYIDEHHRRELLEMADFEEIPQHIMINEINEFNNDTDNPIPSTDEIIQAAQEMDTDDEQVRNIHDGAAVRFIERWFTTTIDNIGLIDQQEYDNMINHIEENDAPGVYLFALDRVIGAHNASVTSNRVGEVEITAHTVLEGTNQRISTQDAAYRLFAHVTGCNNPAIDSIGRYVDDGLRIELYNSADRNNIPRHKIEYAIQVYNAMHTAPELENWEEEQSRKSDIFIGSEYNNDIFISDQDRLLMINRAELFGIDTEIFILSLDAHNREATRQQAINGARREVDEISPEDLQAAADRYDQLVRRPLTEMNSSFMDSPDRDPHNEDDRN